MVHKRYYQVHVYFLVAIQEGYMTEEALNLHKNTNIFLSFYLNIFCTFYGKFNFTRNEKKIYERDNRYRALGRHSFFSAENKSTRRPEGCAPHQSPPPAEICSCSITTRNWIHILCARSIPPPWCLVTAVLSDRE